MKKKLLLILTAILSINCYSQITYEKGYYIDNNNQKTNCLIRNIDWKNNPTEFKYKLSENSEPKQATLKHVKEFGINNISKYIKSTVNIDRSSNDIYDDLSDNKNPNFKKEELFLKVLVEGESTLYEYIDGNLKRFFYNKNNSNIEQLIFKIYNTVNDDDEDRVGVNNMFKQQLWDDLKCPSFEKSKMENLEYKRNKLVNFFVEYNNCKNQKYVNFEKKKKKDLFNLTIRPRINYSSLIAKNSISKYDNSDFGGKIGFGFGVEAEVIFPFNKNKWSIIIEPTYQYFKAGKTYSPSTVDYKSIEIPVGLRHYFFLNDNSKFFVNASYIFDLSSSKSSIKANGQSLKIDTRANLGMGAGYKHNNKYSLEVRFQTNRDIFARYRYWKSEYKTVSIIFGYSPF